MLSPCRCPLEQPCLVETADRARADELFFVLFTVRLLKNWRPDRNGTRGSALHLFPVKSAGCGGGLRGKPGLRTSPPGLVPPASTMSGDDSQGGASCPCAVAVMAEDRGRASSFRSVSYFIVTPSDEVF